MLSRDTRLIWLAGLVVLSICALLVWSDFHPGYRSYQENFRAIVEERFGPERATATPAGLQQIWLESADRVDRAGTGSYNSGT